MSDTPIDLNLFINDVVTLHTHVQGSISLKTVMMVVKDIHEKGYKVIVEKDTPFRITDEEFSQISSNVVRACFIDPDTTASIEVSSEHFDSGRECIVFIYVASKLGKYARAFIITKVTLPIKGTE
jgi:hypothetical protein